MIKLTKPLAIALGLVLISVLSLSLAYAYKTSLNPVIKPKSTESLNQGLKTPYSSFINPKGILLGIILVSAAIIGFFVYKNAIIASPAKAPVIPITKDEGLIGLVANSIDLILMGIGVIGLFGVSIDFGYMIFQRYFSSTNGELEGEPEIANDREGEPEPGEELRLEESLEEVSSEIEGFRPRILECLDNKAYQIHPEILELSENWTDYLNRVRAFLEVKMDPRVNIDAVSEAWAHMEKIMRDLDSGLKVISRLRFSLEQQVRSLIESHSSTIEIEDKIKSFFESLSFPDLQSPMGSIRDLKINILREDEAVLAESQKKTKEILLKNIRVLFEAFGDDFGGHKYKSIIQLRTKFLKSHNLFYTEVVKWPQFRNKILSALGSQEQPNR